MQTIQCPKCPQTFDAKFAKIAQQQPSRGASAPHHLSAPRTRGAPMFDTLTLDDLYALHTKLHQEGEALHVRFMALPSALSDEANLLMAKTAEVSETMHAVYAEIDRRNAEARCDCRTVNDQGGEPRFWDCPVHHA